MQTVLLVVHLIVAVLLIGVILLQKSEGGALGIGGGGGGGGNLFSARGVGNALTRTTAFLALGFFITSISLTLLAIHGNGGGGSLFNTQGGNTQQGETAPTGGSVLPQLPGATPSAPAQQQIPVQP